MITVGKEETNFQQRQNDHLKSKGLPHFVMFERGLGNYTYIWTQSTYDSTAFLSSIVLGHKDKESEHYKDLLKDGYTPIGHPQLSLQFWVQRKKYTPKGIKAIQISFTEQEEHRLLVDEFEMLDPSLGAFDLPEMRFWVLKVDKEKAVDIINPSILRAEFNRGKDII